MSKTGVTKEETHSACSISSTPRPTTRAAARLAGFKRVLGAVSGGRGSEFCGTRGERLAMDWEGQRLAEQLMQYFLLGSALVAFLMGYVSGSFSSMLYIYLAGVVVTFMATVPDWPFFNRHPFTWLEPPCAEQPSKRLLSRQQAAGKKGFKSSHGKR